jgi:hypothetical protein
MAERHVTNDLARAKWIAEMNGVTIVLETDRPSDNTFCARAQVVPFLEPASRYA